MSEFAILSSVTNSSSTLSAELTTTLRDAIITGEIGQGAKLSEAKMAKELDVSRGPLREAIRRLRGHEPYCSYTPTRRQSGNAKP